MQQERAQQTLRALFGQSGFSLVELLVALALTGLVATAVYKTLQSQQSVYIGQDQIVNVQQDARASTDIMMRQLRMAGFNPTSAGGIGFLTATASTARFTADFDSDGDIASDPGEDLTYGITGGALGIAYAGASTLQVLVPDIPVLNFVYLDANGAVVPTPVPVSDLDKIRSVQLTVVARSSKMDRDFIDNETYVNLQGQTLLAPPGDHYRRRVLSTTVNCRNIGLSE